MEKIKAGDKFLCTENIGSNGDIIYTKGCLYQSKVDNCISDNFGGHRKLDSIEGYFEKINSNKVMEKGVKNDSGKLPYYIVLFKQFPLALQEVMKCSAAGNNKYHKTDKDWQNFARVEGADTRYKNAMLRHMGETGSVKDMEEYGGMTHEAAVVWNALADLEVSLRNKNK